MERAFMSPVGPWFRWFAWHPVRTDDRGWRWLRPVWRRRMQTHDYLDGPTLTDWQSVVDREDEPAPPPVSTGEIRAERGKCPRCDSDTCPGRDDILDCTTLVDGLSPRAEARRFLMIEYALRCIDCGSVARSTPDGGWCTRCRKHVFVIGRTA